MLLARFWRLVQARMLQRKRPARFRPSPVPQRQRRTTRNSSNPHRNRLLLYFQSYGRTRSCQACLLCNKCGLFRTLITSPNLLSRHHRRLCLPLAEDRRHFYGGVVAGGRDCVQSENGTSGGEALPTKNYMMRVGLGGRRNWPLSHAFTTSGITQPLGSSIRALPYVS